MLIKYECFQWSTYQVIIKSIFVLLAMIMVPYLLHVLASALCKYPASRLSPSHVTRIPWVCKTEPQYLAWERCSISSYHSNSKDNPWQHLFAGEWGQNLELHPCKRTQPAAGGGHDLILDGSRLGAVPCFSQHGAAVTHQGKPTQAACKSRCVQTTAHTSGRRDQQHVPGFRKSWGLTKGWENPLPRESHTGLHACLVFFFVIC